MAVLSPTLTSFWAWFPLFDIVEANDDVSLKVLLLDKENLAA